ncbi:uncharacterized protein LOC119868085 [Canis lupus familiaris]|uniref:uncharacterized protein LOC119868085 n=1 Tax=Canis lupus familiaris TaxID=9615 RepID=UPI0018F57FCE|nr:uncharacterized protein LOC119868085 [Canis lupus familiaris]
MFGPGREDLRRRGNAASGVRALRDREPGAAALLGKHGGSARGPQDESPAQSNSEPERARLLADPGRREPLGARGAVLPPAGRCRERLRERGSRLGEEPRLALLSLGRISNQLSETRPPEPEPCGAQPSLPAYSGRTSSPSRSATRVLITCVVQEQPYEVETMIILILQQSVEPAGELPHLWQRTQKLHHQTHERLWLRSGERVRTGSGPALTCRSPKGAGAPGRKYFNLRADSNPKRFRRLLEDPILRHVRNIQGGSSSVDSLA